MEFKEVEQARVAPQMDAAERLKYEIEMMQEQVKFLSERIDAGSELVAAMELAGFGDEDHDTRLINLYSDFVKTPGLQLTQDNARLLAELSLNGIVARTDSFAGVYGTMLIALDREKQQLGVKKKELERLTASDDFHSEAPMS